MMQNLIFMNKMHFFIINHFNLKMKDSGNLGYQFFNLKYFIYFHLKKLIILKLILQIYSRSFKIKFIPQVYSRTFKVKFIINCINLILFLKLLA